MSFIYLFIFYFLFLRHQLQLLPLSPIFLPLSSFPHDANTYFPRPVSFFPFLFHLCLPHQYPLFPCPYLPSCCMSFSSSPLSHKPPTYPSSVQVPYHANVYSQQYTFPQSSPISYFTFAHTVLFLANAQLPITRTLPNHLNIFIFQPCNCLPFLILPLNP